MMMRIVLNSLLQVLKLSSKKSDIAYRHKNFTKQNFVFKKFRCFNCSDRAAQCIISIFLICLLKYFDILGPSVLPFI